MNRLNPVSRWLVLFATLLLPVAYFTPIWYIQLWAPQYPEGLEMQIWINKLTGSIDIINGLNHYIGMANIEESMFPELKYLPIVLGVIILLGLITFIANRKSLLRIFTTVILLFAIAAMVDMYIWGYKYGHNLNPHAAIKIEGESYQPPLIGYKQLLNFTALSMPDKGGWALFGAGGVTILAIVVNWAGRRKKEKKIVNLTTVCLFLSILPSCYSGNNNLEFGKDDCGHCGMKLVDNKYGAEIITEKGKVFKFDDINCMINFEAEKLGDQVVDSHLVIDFSSPGKLIDATKAYYLKSEELRSPMGGNAAAFESKDSLTTYLEKIPGTGLGWDEVLKTGF